MFSFLEKIKFFKLFKKSDSSKVAKDRLRLILIHDRHTISYELMDLLRQDLIKIISKYMEINQDSIELALENQNGSASLAANIQVLKIKDIKEVLNNSLLSPIPASSTKTKNSDSNYLAKINPRIKRHKYIHKRRKNRLNKLEAANPKGVS